MRWPEHKDRPMLRLSLASAFTFMLAGCADFYAGPGPDTSAQELAESDADSSESEGLENDGYRD